jgi:hypothetical protein
LGDHLRHIRDVYLMPLTSRSLGAAVRASAIRWGKKWGKKPHRFQPIPADVDLAKTA